MWNKIRLKQVAIFAGLLLMIGLTACSPEQIAIYNSLSPEGKEAVNAHYRSLAEQRSHDCYTAIDRHWPGDKNRARQIVWRESRNQPSAANPRSSARGCFQMLAMHNHRYSAVGCSPAAWSNSDCNVKAAAHLYRQAGWSPWNL